MRCGVHHREKRKSGILYNNGNMGVSKVRFCKDGEGQRDL